MMKVLIFLTIFGGFYVTACSADVESISFNLGSHTEYFNAVQKDTSGGMRKFDFAPTVGVGLDMPAFYDFRFLPELNWVLPQMNEDSKIMKNILMLRADLGYAFKWVMVRAGTSIMWLNQHGKGGSAQVDNGNGASTFYYPDGNQSSFNNTLDLGFESFLNQWSFRLQTFTYMLFKSERRQISYSLFVTYHWDQ